MNPETNEADAQDQARPLHEEEDPPVDPPLDVEADPADVTDQHRPVPAGDEEWPDG